MNLSSTAQNRPGIGDQAALAVAVAIGYLSVNISPVLLGAVSDGLGLRESHAGLLTTLEMFAFGLSALSVGPWLQRLPRRRVAIGAGLLILVSQFASASLQSYVSIALARVAAGVGEGALVATTYSIIAGMVGSQRIYGNCVSITIAAGSLAYFLVPQISDRWGHHGAYAFVGLAVLAAIPMLLRLPCSTGGQALPAASGQTRIGDVVCLLVGILFVLFSDGLVWPLSERIGQSIELNPGLLGGLLGVSVWFGALGSLCAGRIGGRFGFAFPLLGATVVTALGGLLLTHAQNGLHLFLGAAIKNVSLLFFVTLAIETAAVLDRAGRVSALAGGCVPLGASLGPLVAGLLLERHDFQTVGWLGLFAATVALVAIARVVFNLPGRTTDPPPSL